MALGIRWPEYGDGPPPALAVAGGAYAVFLRSYPREAVPEFDRRLAPTLAWCAAGIYGLAVAGFWVAYLVQHAK